MEVRNSINNQQLSPNFGMALYVKKGAEPFLESLAKGEREYVKALGQRIKGSRNNIDINECGKVSSSWTPKASDISLTMSDADRKANKAAQKLAKKKFNSEKTIGESVDMTVIQFKSLVNAAKKWCSFGKSKFMRNLQAHEELQKGYDKVDAIGEKIQERVAQKDAAAKEEAKAIIEEFGKD